MAAPEAMLFDLLMGVMDSLSVWADAAGDRDRGLAWRDAVTRRMRELSAYRPYEDLVAEAASSVGLSATASADLTRHWAWIEPWPDAAVIARSRLPYGFVTNCSKSLAEVAARRSGLHPRFTLSAEEAGGYKPNRAVYEEACRRIGSAPGRTLFVAGSPYDAHGAHDAGLQARLVVRRADHLPTSGDIPVASDLDAILSDVR